MEIEKNYSILKACRFCPMCRHLCTSGLLTNHESDFPRGRALIIYNIYKVIAKCPPLRKFCPLTATEKLLFLYSQ